MSKQRYYQIGQLSELSAVSIRSLRHYDEIGLLCPSHRSPAGYRLYSDMDLLRLQQILLRRQLGLSLDDIRRSLDDPAFDLPQALRQQKIQLQQQMQHTHAMMAAVDRALEFIEQSTQESYHMDMKQIFDGFDPQQHQDEASQRWGDSALFQESSQRTRNYTEADWQQLKQEQEQIYQQLLALMTTHDAQSEACQQVAEQHRLHIDKWFYPCDHTMHAQLAALYESDSRFTQNIDKHGDGLTQFLCAAIRANSGKP